jgi:hypothetical protein
MIKVGKKTKQGYTRTLVGADMTDCYSYGYSALMAVEFLKINKAKSTGVEMGYCISALRQILFAKIKRDNKSSGRLPLGTLLWGKRSIMEDSCKSHGDFDKALGDIKKLIVLWGKHLKKSG